VVVLKAASCTVILLQLHPHASEEHHLMVLNIRDDKLQDRVRIEQECCIWGFPVDAGTSTAGTDLQ
jgi:hypothetical protein